MTTIFDVILTYNIGGIIPLWLPIIIGVFFLFVWLFIKAFSKEKGYEPINLKKKIKEDLDLQYKYFSDKVGQPIYAGMTKLGWTSGYMPMVWNIQRKRYENIILGDRWKDKVKPKMEAAAIEIYNMKYDDLDDVKKKAIRQLAKEELKEDYVKVIKVGDNVTFEKGKKVTTENIQDLHYCFRICKSNFFSKLMAGMFGRGIIYFLVPSEKITFHNNYVAINPNLQRQPYYDHFIFSVSGRELLDNTAFKIERENVMQETANQIPRTVFFDTRLAEKVASLREVAKIEKDKYKSQSENAQN